MRDVILSVSHRAEAIRSIMARERLGEVRLRDVVEREPLGTAGGVRNAADLVDGRVVVLNGDVLTDLDLSAMLRAHEAQGAAATIYLTPVENPTAYGLVELEPDGRVHRFLEKPGWEEVTTNTVNAGVYVLERELLDWIPKGAAVLDGARVLPPAPRARRRLLRLRLAGLLARHRHAGEVLPGAAGPPGAPLPRLRGAGRTRRT